MLRRKKALAVQRLRDAGLVAVAAELERWKNRHGEDAGWDGWFGSTFPTQRGLIGLPVPPARRSVAGVLSRRAARSEVLHTTPVCSPSRPLLVMPDLVVHADWSTCPGPKRQVVRAVLQGTSYRVMSPRAACSGLLEFLVASAKSGRAVVAGFDFAIGVPIAYARAAKSAGARAGVELGGDFLEMVKRLPAEFFVPQDDPLRVSWRQPFFPRTPAGWARLAPLVEGEGKQDWLARRILDDPSATRAKLLRVADESTPHRRAASPLFMLAGAAQVGKASIAGLREIILPALDMDRRVVRIWPYDGPLRELVRPGTVTLLETYPAECYAHFGIGSSAKTEPAWRRDASELIADHARTRGVHFSEALHRTGRNAYGDGSDGEDAFDAMVGAVLLALLVLGHDTVFEPSSADELAWEGSMLGNCSL